MGFDVGGIALTSPTGVTLSVKDGSLNSWMEVDANGILTRPQTPYFRGQISGKGSTYNNGGSALIIDPDVNFGGCWNAGNWAFTCPVAGYYLMAMGSIAGPAGSGYLYARKNNVDQFFGHWNFSGNSWHYISVTGIMQAAQNDYFTWHVTGQSPAAAGVHGNGNHAMYSIALLA